MKVDKEKRLAQQAQDIANHFSLQGKKILDLGCGTGDLIHYIAKKYQPLQITGVDMKAKEEEGFSYKILKGDARKLPFDDNTFDYIYSIATFEHINGVADCLSEIRRILKPRGRFYTFFAPIWTSVAGHHSYCAGHLVREGYDHDEELLYSIPAWGHLYMSKDELFSHLTGYGFNEAKCKEIVHYIYDSDDINRRTASETRNDIMNAGMIVRSYSEYVSFSRKWALNQKGESELTPNIANRIKKTRYTFFDIGVVSMRATLEKYLNL